MRRIRIIGLCVAATLATATAAQAAPQWELCNNPGPWVKLNPGEVETLKISGGFVLFEVGSAVTAKCKVKGIEKIQDPGGGLGGVGLLFPFIGKCHGGADPYPCT